MEIMQLRYLKRSRPPGKASPPRRSSFCALRSPPCPSLSKAKLEDEVGVKLRNWTGNT